MVEHGLIERHRELFLRFETDGGLEFLCAFDRRQLEHPHHDSLIRNTETNAAGELALGEEDLQVIGETIDVDDLTVVKQPRLEDAGGGFRQRETLAVGELCRGDESRLDVQAHNWFFAVEKSHSGLDARRPPSVVRLAH
jgi:hypothetical protein